LELLHVTDLHFNTKQFKWITDNQVNYDIICLTGDLLESEKDETLQEQIVWIKNWFKTIKKPLFVCSGNHDIDVLGEENWLSKIESDFIYPDNGVYTYQGLIIGNYPYIGAEGYFEFDECDILLHHVPPSNSKTAIDKNGKDWGDKALYLALQKGVIKPKYILTGHVHNPLERTSTFLSSHIINPGFSNKSIPAFHHLRIIQ
jgi:Icc-related predicted phosphoesterase